MNGHRILQTTGRLQCVRCGATADTFMARWCSVMLVGREVQLSESWWLAHRGAVGRAVAVRPCGPDMVFCDTGDPGGVLTVVRLS